MVLQFKNLEDIHKQTTFSNRSLVATTKTWSYVVVKTVQYMCGKEQVANYFTQLKVIIKLRTLCRGLPYIIYL